MKKLKYLLLALFLLPLTVYADDIYNRNMDIYITKEGNANITETWTVKADSGTEWYITLKNLGNMEVSNYKVWMDNKELINQKTWNINASLQEKSNKYGINTISNGVELCFGKTNYKKHTFQIKYNLSNIIFNTEDAQVLYNTLIPKTTADNFDIKITSYYKFPDTLDVWGYGYKGYAYVKDGYIRLTTDYALSNEYVTALVKFPKDTFNTTNTYEQFQTFDNVLKTAEEGTFEYDYDDSESGKDYFGIIIGLVASSITLFTILAVALGGKKYIFRNNKKLPKNNEINYCREIPCNKDLKLAYYLSTKYNLVSRKTNLLGSYLLKWIKEGKITINKNGKKNVIIFNRQDNPIDNDEQTIYNMMYAASNDGILEQKDFKNYCTKNYEEVLNFFENTLANIEKDLINEGKIITENKKKFIFNKKYYVLDDTLYNDTVKLKGLKKYFKEFARMYEKMPIEVHLWQEYLIFAQLFGMATKVAKEFKDIYPDVITDDMYDNIIFTNAIYTAGMISANSARSAAESYSSGGGGFSSGGGGGGSFGGGGSSGGR